jgi:nitronate monooxygenase
MALQEANADVIVASGFEAGGHRGSFLAAAEDSLTGTFSLVPQVVDRVSVPVVAAGGIADARGIAAALALGAEGAQLGTAFLACEESGATALHRQTLLSGKSRTALTRGFTGRLARAIKNQLLDSMNAPGVPILPYPLQRFLMRSVMLPAEKSGRADLMPMWSGQSVNLIHHTKAADLLKDLVSGVSDVFDRTFR